MISSKKVSDNYNHRFRMFMTTSFEKLFNEYCTRQRLNNISFEYKRLDGWMKLQSNNTPYSAGMVDDLEPCIYVTSAVSEKAAQKKESEKENG